MARRARAETDLAHRPREVPEIAVAGLHREEPSHGQYLSLHWCPARLLSRMAGHVPGTDCVQGTAGQQVVALLPEAGGDAGGERWRCPGAGNGRVMAGGPGRSR